MNWFELFSYWIYVALMMIGLYAAIAKPNLLKKVLGLSLFQTGIFVFYISVGVVAGGTAPVVWEGREGPVTYADPLPHVLILTAIVVSVSTMAVALSLVVRIKKTYGTIDAEEIKRLDEEQEEHPG